MQKQTSKNCQFGYIFRIIVSVIKKGSASREDVAWIRHEFKRLIPRWLL